MCWGVRGAGSFCAPPRAGMASQLLCFMCALGDQQRVESLALLLPVVQWGAALQMGSIDLTGNIMSTNVFFSVTVSQKCY